jgi:NADH-quinone oxidoreductase subunit J
MQNFSKLLKRIPNTFIHVIVAAAVSFTLAASLYIAGRAFRHTTAFALPAIFKSIGIAIILALAVAVIFLANAVHSLLCLIAVFFGVVVVYLILQAEFLAFVFLIVYVGAVAILFLFVIRLLNIKELEDENANRSFSTETLRLLVALPLALCLSFKISCYLDNLASAERVLTPAVGVRGYVSHGFSDVLSFSLSLYTTFAPLFVLISLLLLTSMLGAIILARTTGESSKSNDDLE